LLQQQLGLVVRAITPPAGLGEVWHVNG
jgi:hypothetical protein